MRTDVTQTANTALQRYSDFKNPSNRSLTKVQNNLAKELLRTITVTVPLVLPDYQPMLLSQRNSKTHSFLNKLRYSPETELINNFDKKSQFRFDCKNTTFCEHHKYKQWIPNLLMLWFYEKHLSGVVSNLKPIPQCYGFMITPCKYLEHLPSTQQNENEIAYECKAKRKLKQSNT